MSRQQKKGLYRIVITAVLLVVLHLISARLDLEDSDPGSMRLRGIMLAAYLVPYLIIGYDILKKAFKGIKNRQPLDENLLMSIATIGALVLAISRTGDFDEAVAVMLFYQVGEFFQNYAIGKSRRNIGELMDIRPDYANIEGPEGLEKVDPDDVERGTIIVVQPGEKVPIDGVVVQGKSYIDTRALTGESLPRAVGEGDEILSGSINSNGVIKIRTTREFGESTASKILDLVENASSRKAGSERFITRFARIYTPVVVGCAILLAIIPPLAIMTVSSASPDWGEWIYRALTFLVVSCPCALVISIPLGFFASIGRASREGILIKGSNFIESLSKVSILVADKTGTLTKGDFGVKAIYAFDPKNFDEKDVVYLAACTERHSSHPIAAAIKIAATPGDDWGSQEKDPAEANVEKVEEAAGKGVCAIVDGVETAVGNMKLMDSLTIDFSGYDDEIRDSLKGCTVVYVAAAGSPAGIIAISDSIKEGAADAIGNLKKDGIKRIIMLTGDGEEAAGEVAARLGITEVHSRLLPEDKVNILERIMEEADSGSAGKRELVAFVGDGINDAPVLSRSDVGIAMGALGSDAAIEAADVVLMDDDPGKIAKARAISRKCMAIVKENIVFAIGVKVLCLLLCAIGLAGMWVAIFADVGVMVLAVLNAVRALVVRNI